MNLPPMPMLPMKCLWAKYDYDPKHLSPNRDGEQTEMKFKQGDRISIYGEMDQDGFCLGELNGLKGLVPSNYVTDEKPSGVKSTAEPKTNKSKEEQGSHTVSKQQRHSTKLLWAKYDYDPQKLSPNDDWEEMELPFRQGDRITIHGEMDEDGFYLGELNGMRGYVPSNFLII